MRGAGVEVTRTAYVALIGRPLGGARRRYGVRVTDRPADLDPRETDQRDDGLLAEPRDAGLLDAGLLDDGLLARAARCWADMAGGEVGEVAPLGGGFANAVARITLADGRTAIVKVAPPATAGLAHERELLRTEAFAIGALAAADAPQPRLLAELALDGREAIVISELPGAQGDDGIPPREIGRVLAALHLAGAAQASAAPTSAAPVFGYPFRAELQAPSARSAYLVLVDAVLDDARRYGVGLPIEPAALRARLAAASVAFDAVAQPTLVHFDLWNGNLLVDGDRITGVIDHERAMWADPTADLASRALFAPVPETIGADAAFRAAYREVAGVEPLPDAAARSRARLWAAYLALIMTVESVPRGYSGDWFAEHDERSRSWLVTTVDALD